MTDSQVLAALREACVADDLVAVADLIAPMGAMSKPSIALAKQMVRIRFGDRFRPRLLNSAIQAERAVFLQAERDRECAKSFAAVSGSSFGGSISRRKNPHAVKLGRLGGLRRGISKGFGAMSAERREAIRLMAVEAVKRKST